MKKIIWIYMLYVGMVMLPSEAYLQTIDKLDADKGAATFRLGTDLSSAYFLGEYENIGTYLVRKKPVEMTEFLGCEVLRVKYLHQRFALQAVVLVLDHKYEVILKNRLFQLYGPPTEFRDDHGVAEAYWLGEEVNLQVTFHYKTDEVEDLENEGEIVLTYALNSYDAMAIYR